MINTNEMPLTQELHVIRAHHLHYTSLLDDFTKHVHFIQDTHSPLMENFPEKDRKFNEGIMKRECDNLLTEIKRLSSELNMQEKRLKNVLGLVSLIQDNVYFLNNDKNQSTGLQQREYYG